MPKAFFDTSALVQAARRPEDWQRVSAHLESEHFVVHPSPQTLFELFGGLENGDDQYWLRNLQPLQILNKTTGPFLPTPGRCLLSQLLGIDKPYPYYEPKDFDKYLRKTVKAKVRGSLKMKLSVLSEHMREMKDKHVGRLNAARIDMAAHGASDYDLSHDRWARVILQGLDTPDSDANVAAIVAATDAAYRACLFLWRQAGDNSAVAYNFSKNENDIGDEQQLHYLCDPDMHFITDDRGVLRKVRGSPQAGRVLLFQDVLAAS
jgi:hypothetical protein